VSSGGRAPCGSGMVAVGTPCDDCPIGADSPHEEEWEGGETPVGEERNPMWREGEKEDRFRSDKGGNKLTFLFA
jgi:adenosylcobinamide amidohydrolase